MKQVFGRSLKEQAQPSTYDAQGTEGYDEGQ